MTCKKNLIAIITAMMCMVICGKSVFADGVCSWEDVLNKNPMRTFMLKEETYASNSLRSKNFFHKQYQSKAIRFEFPDDFPVSVSRTETLIFDVLTQEKCELVVKTRTVEKRTIYMNSYISLVEEYFRRHREYFESEHEGDDYYEHTVYVMTLGFLPEKARAVLRQWFLFILHDQDKMKRYLPGFIKLAIILPFQREYLRNEVRAFWNASNVDFSLFSKQLADGKIYITSQRKKREAFFVRRWRSQKDKDPGTEFELIQTYQLWILKLASVLEIPEAKEWARGVTLSQSGSKLVQELELEFLFSTNIQ